MRHNAKVNEPDAKLRTPLFLAYMHGHIRVGHYLWDHSAEPAMSYGLNTALFVQALNVRLPPELHCGFVGVSHRLPALRCGALPAGWPPVSLAPALAPALAPCPASCLAGSGHDTEPSVQVADIALVRHLLTTSRTIEVYQKTASGQTFLEALAHQVCKVCPCSPCLPAACPACVPILVTSLSPKLMTLECTPSRLAYE